MYNKRIIGQKDLEREITELEETLKIKKEQLEKLRLVNENGKYVLISTGEISELNLEIPQDTWEKYIKQNNTFKTRKDAEKERDRRELLYEFNQFRDERNNGWTPDWKNYNTSKYFIAVDSEGCLKDVSMYSTSCFVQFGYFRNVSDCIEAIRRFGDRIKELYID